MEKQKDAKPPPEGHTDRDFMLEAIAEGRAAGEQGEVPVGAVLVVDGRIVACAHNLRETTGDPLAHAELLALQAGARTLGSWRLDGATLYVTVEPCPMCAGALVQARVSRLVYGVRDFKAGAAGTLFDLVRDKRLNHRLEVTDGILEEECRSLMRDFFQQRRGNSHEQSEQNLA